jgi:hypothetical protein
MLFVPTLAVVLAALGVVVQPACGRSDLELTCVGYRLSDPLISGRIWA